MCALMEELKEKSRKEEREQTKREMAINFLKLGVTKEQIAIATGLSNEELSQLEASISE